MAPPQSVTSKPRWSRYQAPRLLGSADLKNMPPMPVTRFIVFLLRSTRVRYAVQQEMGGTASGENLRRLARAPSSQGIEPAATPERLKPPGVRVPPPAPANASISSNHDMPDP